MDTKDIVATAIVGGVLIMAVGTVAAYGWMSVLGISVNSGFADMAKFIAGSLMTLAGVVLKDWMAAKATK